MTGLRLCDTCMLSGHPTPLSVARRSIAAMSCKNVRLSPSPTCESQWTPAKHWRSATTECRQASASCVSTLACLAQNSQATKLFSIRCHRTKSIPMTWNKSYMYWLQHPAFGGSWPAQHGHTGLQSWSKKVNLTITTMNIVRYRYHGHLWPYYPVTCDPILPGHLRPYYPVTCDPIPLVTLPPLRSTIQWSPFYFVI